MGSCLAICVSPGYLIFEKLEYREAAQVVQEAVKIGHTIAASEAKL
jgi:hypothetical protein